MAHMMKHDKGSIYAMLCHFERREGINFSNKDINKARSYLNYNLARDIQPLQGSKFISKRLKDLNIKTRKNSILMVTWVVTIPTCVKEEDKDYFFKEVFDYLNSMYGKENVINAYVHYDETSRGHVHYAFMPIINSNGQYRLSARDLMNRNHLKEFHSKLDYHMTERLGYPSGIVNGVIEDRGIHYGTVNELKKANTLLDIEHERLIQKRNDTINDINELEFTKEEISNEIHNIVVDDNIDAQLFRLKKENEYQKKYIDKLESLFCEVIEYLDSLGFNQLRQVILNCFDKITHNNLRNKSNYLER